MLDYQIVKTNLTDETMLHNMIKLFHEVQPTIGAFDTETTGVHIICDTPFLFQFGWVDRLQRTIYTYTVDLEQDEEFAKRVISIWHALAYRLKVYLGHNVKFDLHMVSNINLPYVHMNVVDTMAVIRMAHDNVPTRAGGVPLSLKDYTKRYLDSNAKSHDKLLQTERTAIAKQYNKQLQDAFNNTGHIPDGYKSWTVSAMNEYFKDPTFTVDDLPEELQLAYVTWVRDLPDQIGDIVVGRVAKDDIPYNMLNRKNLTDYGHMDIVYTIAVYLQCHPVVVQRENEYGLQIENELIPVFLDMERTGFQADLDYLLDAKAKLKSYIHLRRKELAVLTGMYFTVSQSKVIAEICTGQFSTPVVSTGSEVFDQLLNTLEPGTDFYKFISLVQELRTLEKWYSTYLTRLEHDLLRTDKLYTQINSVGTASGRVTSNFQQFPKGGIKDTDGNELFNPRKIVVVSSGYDGIVYMDYSQIELRVQALYTLILGEGDTNLCRAYMPFKWPAGARYRADAGR